MGADDVEKQGTDPEIRFKYDSWMDIGMVSIIVRSFVSIGLVPESKQLAETYPDLAGRHVPVCYFDIDRNGTHAAEALGKGQSPGKIGIQYFRNAQVALKKFAEYVRANPDSEFANAKYIVGVSRLGSTELGARLGFNIFSDAQADDDHHSVVMAQEKHFESELSRGATSRDAHRKAKQLARKHDVSIAVMPLSRLLERY